MSAQQFGLRDVWGSIIHLTFLLQRKHPPTPALLACFLLLVNFSNCCLWASEALMEHACPPQMIGVPASQCPPAIPIIQPSAMWTCISRADPQGQVCRIPACFSPQCSVPFPPTYGLRCENSLALTQSLLCHFTFLYVVFISPGFDGLFCRLQFIFRVSCICCSCFLRWEEVSF